MGEFPTPGYPAVMQLHKMLLLWMGEFGCFECRWLQAGPSCLGVSLPSAEQMILAPGLLCLYPTNVLASKSGVHVGFAVTVLTLDIFPYFVFYKRAVCPKDTI